MQTFDRPLTTAVHTIILNIYRVCKCTLPHIAHKSMINTDKLKSSINYMTVYRIRAIPLELHQHKRTKSKYE